MEESKFCPNCGTKSEADAKFCPKCGYQFEQGAATGSNQSSQNSAPYRTAGANRQNTAGNATDFSGRVDLMMKWVTQNWATTVIIVIAILAFSVVMQMLFYHASIGLLALVGVLIWLYSFASTNGVEPTSMEMQLRHMTKSSATAVKNSQQVHSDKVAMQRIQAQQNAVNRQTAPVQNPGQVYVQTVPQSNGLGTAGFVLALLSFLFSWVPGVNFLIWFLGALFSFIGLFKQPRGLAITGFILSFLDIILIVILISVIGSGIGLGLLSNL